MFKLIDTASFYSEEDLQVKVLDLASPSKDLVKRAADESILQFIQDIKPHPEKMYLHINAMGAGEFYGSNRNGDYFPEEILKRDYKTFETSPAHVFRHHINKDPAKSIGKVIYSIYNERMHRVELIAEVDKSLGSDIEDRIGRGDYPSTSMACKTPYDVCSICGHQARTREEYCEHIRNSLNKVLPDGRKVMALNVAKLKFFDISIVIRPADVTSSILQKVAGYGIEESSLMAAEIEGLGESLSKSASHQKLADLIKTIDDGFVVGSDPSLTHLMSKVHDPHISTVEVLKHYPITDVLTTMAMLGISPSISYLGELIARKTVGNGSEGYGKLSYEALKYIDVSPEDIPDIFEHAGKVDPLVVKVLSPYISQSSYQIDSIEKRASNVGYAFGGPVPEPRETPQFRGSSHPETANGAGLFKTLIGIALGALAAKWYIASQIDKKLQDARFNRPQNPSDTKIVFIKQASLEDWGLTSTLIKLATEQEIAVATLPKPENKVVSSLNIAVSKPVSAVLSSTGTPVSKVYNIIKKPMKLLDKLLHRTNGENGSN